MFNFFRREPQLTFCIIARFGAGSWMKRFQIKAASSYEACRIFDTDPQYQKYTRVSGATKDL